MLAGIVMEGKRDFPVLEAAICAVCPDIERVIPLYPPQDELWRRLYTEEGVKGSGWTGVKNWCERYGEIIGEFIAWYGEPLDFLVIEVDATIAHNPTINLERPCPPASDTTDVLCTLVID